MLEQAKAPYEVKDCGGPSEAAGYMRRLANAVAEKFGGAPAEPLISKGSDGMDGMYDATIKGLDYEELIYLGLDKIHPDITSQDFKNADDNVLLILAFNVEGSKAELKALAAETLK